MFTHPFGCRCTPCLAGAIGSAGFGGAAGSTAQQNFCARCLNQHCKCAKIPPVIALALPTDNAARKALPIMTFLAEYFPDAIIALTELSVIANEQHNKGERLHWARDKSKDQINTAFRHLFDRARGNHLDSDGMRHIAKTAWRALAQLQLDIEADRK